MLELFVIIVLCGLIAWIEYNNRLERSKLVNALIAKDNHEMVNLELADKTKIEAKPNKQDELVPMNSLSDEEFMDTIKEE